MTDFVTLGVFNSLPEAHFVRGLLEAHGVLVILPDAHQSSLRLAHVNIGGYPLHVHADELEHARAILQQAQESPLADES